MLRQRGFRRLLAVRLTAQLADGLFQAGLAGSVLFNPQRAASPMAVATGFAVLLLPYSVIGPYIGVMLDRWSRRAVIVVTNLLRAALVVPAVVLIWRGAEGTLFLLTTLVIIGFGRLFLAAVSAAIPHVVADRHLVTANAVTNTLGSVGYSLGLGGVALLVRLGLPASFHGYATIAAIAPVGYLVSALVVRRSYGQLELGPDSTRQHHTTLAHTIIAVGRRTADGVRHLTTRPAAAYPLVAQSLHRALYGVLTLAALLRYRSSFANHAGHGHHGVGHSVNGLGSAFVAGGLGLIIAACVTPAITRRLGGRRWIVTLFGVSSVIVAACGPSSQPLLLPVAIGWLSAASQGTKIVVDTALQHECDDDYRGRVFSVNDTLFNLCFVAGTYVGALFIPVSGKSSAVFLTVALGYGAVTVWYALTGQSQTAKIVPLRDKRAAVRPAPVGAGRTAAR